MGIRPDSEVPVPPCPPEVFFTRDYGAVWAAAQVRSGAWEPVVRGAYVAAGTIETPKARALAEIIAFHQRLDVEHWFSHESAAALWGLALWRDPTTTHLRQAGRPAQGKMPVRRHVGAVPREHQAQVNGLPVTSLELTAVDCARSLPPLDALVVADAAWRAGADPARCAALLDTLQGRNGARQARDVLALADPGAESPQETAIRFHLLAAGLPAPQTQVKVPTWCGTYWSDLGYPQWNILIEYDGRTKYVGDEWFREKRRLDAIIEANNRIVRTTTEDLYTPSIIVTRVRHLLPPFVHHPPHPPATTVPGQFEPLTPIHWFKAVEWRRRLELGLVQPKSWVKHT